MADSSTPPSPSETIHLGDGREGRLGAHHAVTDAVEIHLVADALGHAPGRLPAVGLRCEDQRRRGVAGGRRHVVQARHTGVFQVVDGGDVVRAGGDGVVVLQARIDHELAAIDALDVGHQADAVQARLLDREDAERSQFPRAVGVDHATTQADLGTVGRQRSARACRDQQWFGQGDRAPAAAPRGGAVEGDAAADDGQVAGDRHPVVQGEALHSDLVRSLLTTNSAIVVVMTHRHPAGGRPPRERQRPHTDL